MMLTTRPSVVAPVCVLACLWAVTFAQTAPTLTVDKLVARLYQYETSRKTLITMTCLTSPLGKSCAISKSSIEPSNPCGSCFIVLPNCDGRTDNYCLQYLPGLGSLDAWNTPRYLVSVTAKDSDGQISQRLLDIKIITNSPPYFNYSSPSITVQVQNSEQKRAGTILYTVSATDDNNDTLTYTMTTVPDVKQDIVIDAFSGAIRTNKALRELCYVAVTCLVKVRDSYSKEIGPYIVNLDFKGGNLAPLITNLKADLYLREDEPVDKTVLDLKVVDHNTYPSLLYAFSTTPPDMQDFFYFRSDFLKVKKPLDYETQPHQITMFIQASDGYCKSENYKLIIRLVDVNEPPVLAPPDKIFETCEGRVAIAPAWNASDPDVGDVWTFTDVQPNRFGRFHIAEKTGEISTLVDYDLDVTKLPPLVELVVTITDTQHQTGTATLTVTFLDCNDNAPVFPKGARQVLKVTTCDPLGKVLGTVPRATDLDSDFRQNNVITYSGSSGLVEVDKDGNIVLKGKFKQGQFVSFPVLATDKGEHPGPLTSKNPLWVSVYAEACPYPDIPTTVPRTVVPVTTAPLITTTMGLNVAEEWGANEIWILAAAVLATALFLLALFMFFRYCLSRCLRSCRPAPGDLAKGQGQGHHHGGRPQPLREPTGDSFSLDGQGSWGPTEPVREPSPEQSKRGPGFIFGWWKEMFQDTDYKKTPNRAARPEPNHGEQNLVTHTYDPAD